MENTKEFYSTQELIEESWFPVKSTITIHKLIQNGDLVGINIGTSNRVRYRIPKESAIEFIKKHGVSVSKKS